MTAEPTDHRRTERWILALCWLLALLKLWLVHDHLLGAFADARIDDRLFINLAQHLLAGEWLGPYDRFTLIKGPFYPMWIAATYYAGIPLLLSHHLLEIAAGALLVVALRPLLPALWLRALLFAALLFNPMSYTSVMAMRALREGIYPAQGILITACAVALLGRAGRPLKQLLPWAAGLGLALGSFWLNREEGIWILPLMAPVVGLAAYRVWRSAESSWRWRSAAVVAVLPVALAAGCYLTVAAVNRAHYGVFTVVEFKTSYFTGAYGAVARVEGEWHPRVPISREMREKIYPVSPAFAELRPFLEGAVGDHWAKVTCGRFEGICDEVAGGWFMWAFREAVDNAGHHTSARAARDYYRRLAGEINTACDDGRLRCHRKRVSMRPRLDRRYLAPLVETFLRAALFQARFGHFESYQVESRGDPLGQQLFGELTGEPLAAEAESFLTQVRGWAVSSDRLQLVALRPDGRPANRHLRWEDRPELGWAFRAAGVEAPKIEAARFVLNYFCPEEGCQLHVRWRREEVAVIPLDGGRHSVEHPPDVFFELEPPAPRLPGPPPPDLASLRERILKRIHRVYEGAIPWLALLALGGWLRQTVAVVRRRELTALWVFESGLLAAAVLRLGIIAMLDISTVPALVSRYLCPSHPQLLAFSVLAGAGLLRDGVIALQRRFG